MNKLMQLKKPGSAIVLVMFAIVILFVIGGGLLSLGLQGRILAAKESSEIAARTAADAGLEKAVFEMNEKLKVKPWSDSVLPSATYEAIPNCNATFSYTVTVDTGGGYTISNYLVTATGNYGTVQKQVSCTLTGQWKPFSFALFGDQNISLSNSSTVDQYNTTGGTPELQVGTNSVASGAISLSNSSIINGAAVVGVNGNPATVVSLVNSSKVTGNKSAQTASNTLASVTVPSSLTSLPSSGALSLINSATKTLNSSAQYSSINISNSSILTINGPVSLYVTGNISISNSSQITVVKTNPNASLTIYIGGNLSAGNSSNINNQTQDASKAQILGLDTCTSIGLGNSSNFYGCVYTPKAQVTLGNSCGTYGSVIAKNVKGVNSSQMHYDASLKDLSIASAPTAFIVKNWSDN